MSKISRLIKKKGFFLDCDKRWDPEHMNLVLLETPKKGLIWTLMLMFTKRYSDYRPSICLGPRRVRTLWRKINVCNIKLNS